MLGDGNPRKAPPGYGDTRPHQHRCQAQGLSGSASKGAGTGEGGQKEMWKNKHEEISCMCVCTHPYHDMPENKSRPYCAIVCSNTCQQLQHSLLLSPWPLRNRNSYRSKGISANRVLEQNSGHLRCRRESLFCTIGIFHLEINKCRARTG